MREVFLNFPGCLMWLVVAAGIGRLAQAGWEAILRQRSENL